MKPDTLTSFPPTIDLGSYHLRPLRPADAPAWYAYLSDPEVTRLTSYDVRSQEMVAHFIAVCRADYNQRRSCRWALADKASDQLIGTCGYSWWNVEHAIAELGYDLSRNFWGGGLMTQAVQAAVRWAFDDLQANRLQATVMVGNTASVRVLEKGGFQKEGLLRDYKICRGEARDFWIFGQLRRDYRAR